MAILIKPPLFLMYILKTEGSKEFMTHCSDTNKRRSGRHVTRTHENPPKTNVLIQCDAAQT